MSVKRNTPNEMFMGPTRPARPNGWTATGVLFVALVIAIWASVTIIDAPNWMILLLEAAVILIAVVAILKRSYLGIAFIVGSLPILALLPDIPFATSIFPLVGGVTLISYVVQQRWGIRPGTTAKVGPPLANAILVLGVIFVAWSISSNPVAAMVEGDRNWAFTLIQLLAILWLASKLFIDKRVHQAVFLSFAATAVLSAIVAILTVTNPSLDNRAVGLAGGANSAARYFVIALIFLNYFRESTNRPPFQLLIMAGMIILLMGLLLTLSRTGLILAILSFLLILFKPNPVANRRRLRIGLFLILISLWLVPDQVFTDLAPRIFSSISEGSDTVGLRYQLGYQRIPHGRASSLCPLH
ncbi:MAG: hypothetical protein KF716_22450 [Anaerolineae bacterium]|nr:hypothetical protein [Anaerolineae bacterium]